jgi:hypothetical protein
MAKDVRYSRTQAGGGSGLPATAPTISSPQVTPRAVPDFKSALAGTEGLSAVLQSFFGQAQAGFNSIQQGIMIAQKHQIEIENKAQQRQGEGDALAGRAPDPKLTNDLDYYDTYRSVLATKTGVNAANDFQDWYLKEFAPQNPTGDLNAARDEWVKQHLAGSQDKDFEGQTLAAFYKATDHTVASQRENAVRIQIQQGVENLNALIDADAKANGINPDRLAYYIQAARTLDPLNPHEAAPRVAAAIAVAAQNHPENAASVLSALGKPGSGINGKSFAESFPDAYAKVQENAVQSWQQTNTMEEWQAVDGLKQRAAKFASMTDDELVQYGVDLSVTMNKYGSATAITALRHDLATEIERRAQVGAHLDGVQAMLLGATPLDAGEMRKYLPSYVETKLGVKNILQGDPAQMASVLVHAGGIVPEDYKAQISQALTSFENPKAQMAAMTLLDHVQTMRDRKFAEGLLNDTASRYFNQVVDQMNLTGDPMEQVVQSVNAARRNEKAKDLTWTDLVGKAPQDSRVAVNDAIKSAVTDAFGPHDGFLGFFKTQVNIPPAVYAQVSDYALQVAIERGGQIGWDKAITEAVQRMQGRAEVLPGPSGYTLTVRSVDRPPVWVDAQGNAHERIQMGFEVPNPNTGKPVSTVAVYEQQLKDLSARFRPLLPDGHADNVSLGEDYSYASAAGAYAIYDNGVPITFDEGDQYKAPPEASRPPAATGVPVDPITGDPQIGVGALDPNDPLMAPPVTTPKGPKEITFSNEVGKMDWANQLPEGFFFLRFPLANGKTGYMLAYRPNFGDQAGKSLDQRAADFNATHFPQ